MSCKIGAIIFLLINLSTFEHVSAQYKYSIDIEVKKGRRVPLNFLITQTKQDIKLASEVRKKNRATKKASKAISRHTYNIQTKEVRKRMRRSKRKAKIFNRGKVPLSVKLKMFLNG